MHGAYVTLLTHLVLASHRRTSDGAPAAATAVATAPGDTPTCRRHGASPSRSRRRTRMTRRISSGSETVLNVVHIRVLYFTSGFNILCLGSTSFRSGQREDYGFRGCSRCRSFQNCRVVRVAVLGVWGTSIACQRHRKAILVYPSEGNLPRQ